MSRKWRKTTALALCLALLLLSVTAEFAHRHANRIGIATDAVATADSDDGVEGAIGFGLNCVACVHAVTNFAAENTTPSYTPTLQALLLHCVEETFNARHLDSFHSVRAPPDQLA